MADEQLREDIQRAIEQAVARNTSIDEMLGELEAAQDRVEEIATLRGGS